MYSAQRIGFTVQVRSNRTACSDGFALCSYSSIDRAVVFRTSLPGSATTFALLSKWLARSASVTIGSPYRTSSSHSTSSCVECNRSGGAYRRCGGYLGAASTGIQDALNVRKPVESALGDMGKHCVADRRVALKCRIEGCEQPFLPRLQLRDNARAQLHVVCNVVADEHLIRALRWKINAGARV